MCKYEYTQLEFRGTQLHTKIEAFAYTMKIIIVYLDIMDCNSMLKLAHSLSFIKIKIVISLSNVVVASTYYGITSLDSFIHKFSRLYFMLVAKQLQCVAKPYCIQTYTGVKY